ncbi:spore germination protein [Paenibacillus ginsengarvi]|uniref:Spore germination protein n=1 Tax=Paenibacillus ginsengarvi TaxID=400777 RepID=A0A3B0CL22_9BACL|nr:spore germination protein [Paenibacillus ginsengarvi]
MNIQPHLKDNISYIRNRFGNSKDFIVREIVLGKNREITLAFTYIEGLIDKDSVFRLLDSMLLYADQIQINEFDSFMRHLAITVGDIGYKRDFAGAQSALLAGETVIWMDTVAVAIAVNTRGGEMRHVSEPVSQTVVRGPQDGFTETLTTNLSLVRRRIKNPNLWVESKQLGRVTKTDVALMFIHGLVKDELLEELRTRLAKINLDGILESNYIEEFIQDETFTVFPTVNNTERPDVVAAALLEGRVAIFVDGTPFVLLVPGLFTQFLQSPEDYYHRSDYGLLRVLRYISLLVSLLAPALYIAITTFHQEMIPTSLLISLAAQREGIPFPAFIEALMMEVTFELLREAGVRMPRAVGTSISIVGALVLGQAAVEAGLVSPAMVIIVSITAITGFIFPSFEIGISIRLLRFVFMGLAASFGFFGIIIGLIALILHLCHLQSFGVPYMTPFAPFQMKEQKDNVVRVPWWQMYSHLMNPTANKRRHSADVGGESPPSPRNKQKINDPNEGESG